MHYDKIDVSEGNEVNKTSASKICGLFHHWSFKIGFKLEDYVCNGCHDLLARANSLKDVAILSAKGATFRCILMGISKNEALKRLYNSVTRHRGIV